MRFNRQLFKEAYKAGYKRALRLNEKTSYERTRQVENRNEQVRIITDNMYFILCQELGGEELIDTFYGTGGSDYLPDENADYMDEIYAFVNDHYSNKPFNEILEVCDYYYNDAVDYENPFGSSTINSYGSYYDWFERAKPVICKQIAKCIKDRSLEHPIG